MTMNLSTCQRCRKSSFVILALVLTSLLLLTGWRSVQAARPLHFAEPQPALQQWGMRSTSSATGTVTSTLYLPVVAQTVVQTVTIVAPQPAWTAAWWQWIEAVNSAPLYQQGPTDCGLGQTGDIWFLAGTDGTDPATRSCTVPPNKLFVVPLHTAAWANEGIENLTVAEKRDVLDTIYSTEQPGPLNTKICQLTSTIDGEVASYVRLQSPPFQRQADPEAVADGSWFAFQLASGAHVVAFQGTLCDFDSDTPTNDVDVTYTLEVDPAAEVPGETWQLFVWNTNINALASGCSPTDPSGVTTCSAVSLGRNAVYAGTPPWSYVAPAAGAILTVVDTASGGDEFEVFDNDVLLGRTSPSQDDANCPVPTGGDPGVCLKQAGMSSGAFDLGSGAQAITIKPVKGFFAGVGYFRFEPKAAAVNR